LVNEALKRLKCSGAVDFVEDHQPVFVARRKNAGSASLAVFDRFEVEVESVSGFGDSKCERCLADLPGPNECDCSLPVEGILKPREDSASDHPEQLNCRI
jgi:hypothetical protein